MTSFETQRVVMDLLELQLVLCEYFIGSFLTTDGYHHISFRIIQLLFC
jgi:hypothetical protein